MLSESALTSMNVLFATPYYISSVTMNYVVSLFDLTREGSRLGLMSPKGPLLKASGGEAAALGAKRVILGIGLRSEGLEGRSPFSDKPACVSRSDRPQFFGAAPVHRYHRREHH